MLNHDFQLNELNRYVGPSDHYEHGGMGDFARFEQETE
jgi:hypothetical protein